MGSNARAGSSPAWGTEPRQASRLFYFMRYFLHIAYEGTNYCGWQQQADVLSVQEVFEKTLAQIFKKEVPIWGCGRTDSGVHASQYIGHINLYEEFDFDLKFRLNKNLPDDITVLDVLKMQDGQHARFDATSRTYDYFLHFYKDAFLKKYSSEYDYEPLDIEAMQQAVLLFTKYKDYKSICKQAHLYENTICDVTEAKLFVSDDNMRMRFTITSNRFLRGMVRLCVAFLLKIGRGEMSISEFQEMFANKIVLPLNYTTLPNGLYLSKVEYPYLALPERANFCEFLKKGLVEVE